MAGIDDEAGDDEAGEDEVGGDGRGGEEPIERDPKAKLLEEVAAQMDAIEADFGEDFEIGNFVTVVEVVRPEGAGIRVRGNQQPWVGIGMLRVAEKMLEGKQGPG